MTGPAANSMIAPAGAPTRAARVAVVVGNPRPGSRTRAVAAYLADQLAETEPEPMIELAALGPALLDRDDPAVAALVDQVRSVDLVVVASPTYKATYTGLLKVFLDRFPADGLRGVVAVPVMVGSSPDHALAPEYGLRPLLTELGATVPTRGLYVLETAYDDPAGYASWLDSARLSIGTALTARARARR
jgi:FMN reductase